MTQPAPRLAEYKDLFDLPDNVVGQILGGAFDRGRRGPGGWWLVDEPELHLAGSNAADEG